MLITLLKIIDNIDTVFVTFKSEFMGKNICYLAYYEVELIQLSHNVNWQSHSSRLIFHVFKDLFLWLFTEYFSLNFFQLWARPVLWLGMWVACLANMSVRQLELPSSPTNCKFQRDKLLPFLLSVALTVEHNWNRCTDIHIHRHISF